jgi:hypothetical protein
LHNGRVKAIDRIKDMQRKPKYFDMEKFYAYIDDLMNKYEENNGHV